MDLAFNAGNNNTSGDDKHRGLKTLHLTNAWHASSGGIGTFFKALFQAADREGHYIRLIVPSDSTRVEEVSPFCRIYHVEAPVAIYSPSYRMLYPPKYLIPGSIIGKILNEEQPDLVEISEKYTLNYLGGLLRTRRLPWVKFRPTVVSVSHERMDENFRAYVNSSEAAQRFCRWYMKAIYFALFDHHIAVSEHTAQELIAASRGHKIQRGIWITPMGVDSAHFRRDRYSPEKRRELAARLGTDPNNAILVYCGRLAPEKNVGLLVETMRELSADRYHLAIIGQGIDEPKIREAGLKNISLLGFEKDREKLAEIYANADIFLHPNPREPFGIAPLEAMASGMLLVAPDSGGVTTYANATNAWLTKPDGTSFATAVQSAWTSPNTEARRTAARATAEGFDWTVVTARILKLYRELHELTQGRASHTSIAPRAVSTIGDFLGREIPPPHDPEPSAQ